MSSAAGQAMYPHLAKAERETELRDRSESKGEWGKPGNVPLWGDVRPISNRLDRVPGLVRRKVNR